MFTKEHGTHVIVNSMAAKCQKKLGWGIKKAGKVRKEEHVEAKRVNGSVPI